MLLTGCSTLVHDGVASEPHAIDHCSGADWVSDLSVAVLPIPVVAFFVPHVDTNEIRANDYLGTCGDSQRLIDRKVQVNRAACVPASLTRVVSLGIWQWCPARVSWEAGVAARY